MREDHGVDEAEAVCQASGKLVGTRLEDGDGGEQRTQHARRRAESHVEPVGDQRVRDHAAAERVEREQTGQAGQRTEVAQDSPAGLGRLGAGRQEQGERAGCQPERRTPEEGRVRVAPGDPGCQASGRPASGRPGQRSGERVTRERPIAGPTGGHLGEHSLFERGERQNPTPQFICIVGYYRDCPEPAYS